MLIFECVLSLEVWNLSDSISVSYVLLSGAGTSLLSLVVIIVGGAAAAVAAEP